MVSCKIQESKRGTTLRRGAVGQGKRLAQTLLLLKMAPL